MLLLTRKVGQRIVIDGGIVVVINRIEPHRVSIGIEAPRTVGVRREEIAPQMEPTPPPSDQAHD